MPSRSHDVPPSSVYTRDYFLSDACEGFDEFREGGVSGLKQQEIAFLDAAPGMRVLDVGCGRGEVIAELRKRDIEVIGVDYAEDAVLLARELLGSEPPVARADATTLPFADASFDRVLMGDVIEHLPWPVGVAALRDIGRVLRPGGFVLVHTAPNRIFSEYLLPIAGFVLKVLGRKTLRARITTYQERKEVMHPNELSPLGLRKMLREAGLAGRVWVSPDIMRSSVGAWTGRFRRMRSMQLLARVAGMWPLRQILGNDLFAKGARG